MAEPAPTPRPTSLPAPPTPREPVAQPYPGIFFIEGKSLGHSPTPTTNPQSQVPGSTTTRG